MVSFTVQPQSLGFLTWLWYLPQDPTYFPVLYLCSRVPLLFPSEFSSAFLAPACKTILSPSWRQPGKKMGHPLMESPLQCRSVCTSDFSLVSFKGGNDHVYLSRKRFRKKSWFLEHTRAQQTWTECGETINRMRQLTWGRSRETKSDLF